MRLSLFVIQSLTMSMCMNICTIRCRVTLLFMLANIRDCISAHIHFKKFPGGHGPGPPRKIVAIGHLELLLQTINPR